MSPALLKLRSEKHPTKTLDTLKLQTVNFALDAKEAGVPVWCKKKVETCLLAPTSEHKVVGKQIKSLRARGRITTARRVSLIVDAHFLCKVKDRIAVKGMGWDGEGEREKKGVCPCLSPPILVAL